MRYIHTRTTTDAEHRSAPTRTRWAAIGAAVAVTLGAGGLGVAQATVDSGDKPVFIAIEPCRLVDTRPEFLVGGRATPLNPDETYTLVGTGAQGDCNVPAGVKSLATNVTALNATAPTFLRFAPGTSVPAGEGSSLNPVPGQPPTPNAVTTSIDGSGQFSVYNLAGTVDIIIDVVGYYDHHVHTGDDIVDGSLTGADVLDESLTGADVLDESLTGADIDDGTVSSADTSNEPGVVSFAEDTDAAVTTTEEVYGTVRIRPPSDGFVRVSASVDWFAAAGQQIRCSLTDGTTAHTTAMFRDSAASGLAQTFSIEATFPVEQYTGLLVSGQPFNLVCDMAVGAGSIGNVIMSAMYVASSYAPINFVFPVFPITLEAPEAGDG